ncbi:MAG: penicillin-binding protein 2 [Armatimonadetes bacterium]|nr:penicillin-binding protein 2 [Armatimonadota bacterium]
MSNFRRRVTVLKVFCGCLLLVFVIRLGQLQIAKADQFMRQAAANRTQTIRVEPPRGCIFDRQGRVLAENRRTWRLGIDPATFPKDEKTADQCIVRLAGLLGGDASALRRAIRVALVSSVAQPIPIPGVPSTLEFPTVARIEENRLELPGIVVLEESKRYYPQGRLAAHVLGYARVISEEQYRLYRDILVPQVSQPQDEIAALVADRLYGPRSITGHAGIERTCELDTSWPQPMPLLMGLPGRTVLDVNVRGEPVRVIASREPAPGASLYLTIDAVAQRVAEEAMEEALKRGPGRGGAVVAVDVGTGEVLVLCSKPSFDPNAWVTGLGAGEWERVANDPRTPLLNRAIGGAYPPGSTFKMISSVAAFETLRLAPSTSFRCAGRITVGWRHAVYGCWRSGGHGTVDFWRGMAESCDVYFYELVRQLGLTADSLAFWARQFGFGQPAGVALPGEAEGLVPDPAWRRLVMHESWRLGDTLNMVIGQGYLAVTPLQMAMATATIANGGKLYQPLIVRKVLWPSWTGLPPRVARPILVRTIPVSPATLEKVRRSMREAVTSQRGTSRVMQGLGVSVAGKTGSAEHRPGCPTHAWYACFAPYEKPRYAVVVLVESGGHGGAVAAPIARRVVAALFRLNAGVGGPSGPSD